jgi:TorA maturation chaperone TorD
MPGTDLADADAWADLLAALATSLRRPDEGLVAAAEGGELADALRASSAALDLRPVQGTQPPAVGSVGELTESYVALFEAMQTPYAPNAESPYKQWYGGASGMMAGPPAEEMARRYTAADAEFPGGYPADHVALLLEYAALLLEEGADGEFGTFVDDHLDWIPAFRLATEGAAADAPFHTWAIRLLDDVTTTLRSRLDVEPVDQGTARGMVDRVQDAAPPAARH